MNAIAFDTSTGATVVGVAAGETVRSRRLGLSQDGRPRHSGRLLAELEELLGEMGLPWAEIEAIGVGAGPGTFTGMRIAAATAEGLRRATGACVVPVDSLEALALPVLRSRPGRKVCAVIDARRGEAFASGWSPTGERLFGPVAVGPAGLTGHLLEGEWVVAGEMPEAYAEGLDSGIAEWLTANDPLNLIDGELLCELTERGTPIEGPVGPEYVRAPDAQRPRT